MPLYAILADQRFGPSRSKTANAIIRYRPSEVAAVVDSSSSGRSAQDVLGYGADIPIVDGLKEALALGADALLIGVAPAGGTLPRAWRPIVAESLRAGLDVVSGLHARLASDPEFSRLSGRGGARIVDLRHSDPTTWTTARGRWRSRQTPVVLSVGTDCNVGKMTALWEVHLHLLNSGVRSAFVGTGQTGILLSGRGVAVDAVVSDFVSGVVEAQVEAAISELCPDVVLVEGQGALTSLPYSGVTLGLLHGAMPDAMLMVHQPARTHDHIGCRIPQLSDVIDHHNRTMAFFNGARVVAVGVNGFGLPPESLLRSVEAIEAETGLPTIDAVASGPGVLADAITRTFGLVPAR